MPRYSNKRYSSLVRLLVSAAERKYRSDARGTLCIRIQVEHVRSTAGVDCAYGKRREKPGGRFRAGIVPARRR